MKATLPLLAVFAALLCMADAPSVTPWDIPPPQPKATTPGRFTLFAAPYGNETKIFRLDTATGKAWTYETANIGPNRLTAEGWSEVPESFDYTVGYFSRTNHPTSSALQQ